MREARRLRGLELTQVGAQIDVQAKYLRALEWDRPDLLPDPETAQRILRTYAGHLELDLPELRELEEDTGELGPPVTTIERPAYRPGTRWNLSREDGLAALVSIVPAAIAAGIVLFLASGSPSSGGTPSTPARPPASEQPAAPAQPPAVPSRPRANRPTPVAIAPTKAPASRPKLARLEIVAARGDSWVTVRADSGRGAVLFADTLAKGRSLRLQGRRLWVRLGAATSLDVRVNGVQPDLDLYGTLDAIVTGKGFQKVPLGP